MAARSQNTVRMVDVAKEAGVSLTTVGQVLLGTGGKNVRVAKKTAERVRKVAVELNYHPNPVARQLAGMKSKIIGILVDPSVAPGTLKRLAEMEDALHDRGYRLMIGHPMNDEDKTSNYVEDFLARGIEGAICLVHGYPGKALSIAKIVNRLKHVVFIMKPAVEDAYYVTIDEVEGSRQIVRYLHEKGRKRIGIAISDTVWPGMRNIRAGYFKELHAQNLSIDDGLTWVGGDMVRPDPQHISPEISDLIVTRLVIENKADAIIAANDFWAARIINSLQKKGFNVPKDVAVVGRDNLEIATYIEPNITSLDSQHKLAALSAVNMLVELIEKNVIPASRRCINIKPTLIERDSA